MNKFLCMILPLLGNALLAWPQSPSARSIRAPLPPYDSGYVAPDGYVVVEAEDLPHSAKWQLQADDKNYTGRGYLKWTGGTQGSGEEQEEDRTGKLQGAPADWLVVPVKITRPGVYRVDLRNRHARKDGDNDAWVHIVDWPLPVRRVGDHAEATYQWLTWGPDWVTFNITRPGVYAFYVAGRSDGFGVDRIAVYHEDAPVKFRHRHHPVSPRVKL